MYNCFLQNNKKVKNFGFSLIELSIVLIIIGLLIVGIAGGASLIESAKMRALSNEFINYKQALNTFYVVKSRLPGDLTGKWKIGYKSGQTYNANSFPAPYNENGNGYGIPNLFSAPFVDLYLAGVINFEPKSTNTAGGGNFLQLKPLANAGGVPKSNVIKDFIYSYRYDPYEPPLSSNPVYFRYGIREKTSIQIFTNNDYKDVPRIIKKLDFKIDDGLYNSGNFRSYCGTGVVGTLGYTNYTNAKVCPEAIFLSDL